MGDSTSTPARARWARFRFGIIAPLLTAPPESGELGAAIAALAARSWPHPTTGESIRLSAKSIERWFYLARAEEQPIEALARKVPRHAGSHPSVAAVVAEELRELRRAHPRWSYQLVFDNLVAVARDKPQLGILPSYSTVCRYMKHHGLGKHRKPRRHELEPGFVPRERRSFEVSHVHALCNRSGDGLGWSLTSGRRGAHDGWVNWSRVCGGAKSRGSWMPTVMPRRGASATASARRCALPGATESR